MCITLDTWREVIVEVKTVTMGSCSLTQSCHFVMTMDRESDEEVSGNLFPESMATFTGIRNSGGTASAYVLIAGYDDMVEIPGRTCPVSRSTEQA